MLVELFCELVGNISIRLPSCVLFIMTQCSTQETLPNYDH
jgi:hypothetical protein